MRIQEINSTGFQRRKALRLIFQLFDGGTFRIINRNNKNHGCVTSMRRKATLIKKGAASIGFGEVFPR